MSANDPATRYFEAIASALSGLDVFLRDDSSPLYRHDLIAKVMGEYIGRLENSFTSWRNRLGFMESFRISRAESGFPVFQNVLELENDRSSADKRLAAIPEPEALRAEMADFILRQKAMPPWIWLSVKRPPSLQKANRWLLRPARWSSVKTCWAKPSCKAIRITLKPRMVSKPTPAWPAPMVLRSVCAS